MAVDDAYTKSLLHFDGADTSTTFTDESGKTWTARGTAQIDTAQSVFGGASGLFDGNSDWVDTPDHDDWQLDGGSNSNLWTVDFRTRFNGDPGASKRPFFQQYVDNNNAMWFFLDDGVILNFQVTSGGADIIRIENAWNPAGDTWYHIALVKDGVNGYMVFVNGTQIGSTQTDTSTIPNLSAILEIGRRISAGGTIYLNGWMDEVRFSKGIARWTSNFTPPTKAYSPFIPQIINII